MEELDILKQLREKFLAACRKKGLEEALNKILLKKDEEKQEEK